MFTTMNWIKKINLIGMIGNCVILLNGDAYMIVICKVLIKSSWFYAKLNGAPILLQNVNYICN